MAEWIKSAKVGDKVVCVDDDYPFDDTCDVFPQRDHILTIRSIVVCRYNDTPFFRFVEITNRTQDFGLNGFVERAFDADGFRPVQPRKSDISVFTRLLNTTPADLVEA